LRLFFIHIALLMLVLPISLLAQKTVSDSVYKNRINALTAKDSVFGTKAKKVIPKKLYDLLFRDIYNSNNQEEVSQIEENPFKKYEGRVIHKIYIRRLEVFGYSVYDTLRRPTNWIDRTGNKLHWDTREGIIKHSYLFFEEGDLVNTEQLQNNERYLRQQNIFHDARIEIVPLPKTDKAVNVYVTTQDVWSLLPEVSASALNNFSIGFEQRNFQGLSHSFRNILRYNGNDSRQKFEYRSRYFIPSFGRTYISSMADFAIERDLKQVSFKAFRPFLTPQTKWAGAAEIGNYKERRGEYLSKKSDSLVYFWAHYNFLDTWVGRSFPLFFGNEKFRKQGRIIVSARFIYRNFTKLDASLTTDNSNYQNVAAKLISVGYSNRSYVRDLLIYGFGRTEDVPVGESLSVVYGQDNASQNRHYTAIKASAGRYLSYGYIYGIFGLGGYLKDKKIEQGVVSLSANFISPLIRIKKSNIRLMPSMSWTNGIRRPANDYLNISGEGGIQGVYSDALRGSRKLVFNFETVWFSNFNLLGFRMAPYTFGSLGWVNYQENRFFEKTYSAIGIGFRFRNESLTFSTFQVRLGYYPNIPNLSSNLRLGFDSIAPLRFQDFDISAPEILLFR
jgi:hypothetical protein